MLKGTAVEQQCSFLSDMLARKHFTAAAKAEILEKV